MRQWHWQVAATLLVILGVGSGGASAELKLLRPFRKDRPEPIASPVIPATPVAVPHDVYPSGPVQGDGLFPRYREMMHSHGVGCKSDYNEIQSGSFHSTAQFIFGSSRSFFRESCDPNPPLFPGTLFSGSLFRDKSGCNGCR